MAPVTDTSFYVVSGHEQSAQANHYTFPPNYLKMAVEVIFKGSP
jgi:hypothetical protein